MIYFKKFYNCKNFFTLTLEVSYKTVGILDYPKIKVRYLFISKYQNTQLIQEGIQPTIRLGPKVAFPKYQT